MEVQIYNLRYLVEMGCGLDTWRPFGNVWNHPNIKPGGQVYTSTPVSLDEENLKFTTASGRIYKIMSFEGDRLKILEQIKKDIINRGTECW